MSYNALPYGTYPKVNYQTVDFTIFNRNASLLIKALSILTLIIASVILVSYIVLIIVPVISSIVMTTQFAFTFVGLIIFSFSYPKGTSNATSRTA